MYLRDEIIGQVITGVRQATVEEKEKLLGDTDQQLVVIELLDGRVIAPVMDNRPALLVSIDATGQEGLVFSEE